MKLNSSVVTLAHDTPILRLFDFFVSPTSYCHHANPILLGYGTKEIAATTELNNSHSASSGPQLNVHYSIPGFFYHISTLSMNLRRLS